MRQVSMDIDVGPDESTAQVLTRLKSVPPGSQILLRIPKDAKAMRALDDFNDLRKLAGDRQLSLTIASPEKTVRGLAGILGFEVEGKAAGPSGARPAGAPGETKAAAPTA